MGDITKAFNEDQFQQFINDGEPPCDYSKTLLQEHPERVKYILEGGYPPPYELEIQPFSDCNLKCNHCFGKNYEKIPHKMTKEALEVLAKKAANFEQDGFKIDIVKFCGTTGEPLFNPATINNDKLLPIK